MHLTAIVGAHTLIQISVGTLQQKDPRDVKKNVNGGERVDYSKYEPDHSYHAFKDRRKKKCGGVRGKSHKYTTEAGNDCRWEEYIYWWSDSPYWRWVCECRIKCVGCGVSPRRYGGDKCAHRDYMKFTKPEGVKTI